MAEGDKGLMRVRWAACAAVGAVVFLLASCGGTSNNPTPTVGALYPETVSATLVGPPTCASNPSPFTLNVSGTNFMDTSVAYWNGSKRATTFNQNTGQLAVTVLACDIANPGINYVSVVNPPPGGGPSQAAAPFQVTQPTPAAIKTISPASTTQNVLPPGGILTIHGEPAEPGSNSAAFASNSQVLINGEARATTYVSATELQVQLLPADVATVGSVGVTVTNSARGGGPATARFSVTDPPNAANFPRVISVSATGGAANGASSWPAMSADGRYVAFYSEATNLVASGASGNIFVRDTCIGAANCTPHTIAVDLAPDGSAPNLQSGAGLAISGNGRYIAFTSHARNLVPGIEETSYGPEDGDLGLNVFVRDLCNGKDVPEGCIPKTDLVSQTVSGEPTTGYAIIPSISADGRFISFLSPDSNLAPGLSASGTHVFVRDTCAGAAATANCAPQTFAFAADSADPAVAPNAPMISANARYLTFAALHPSSGGVSEFSEILVLDTCLGLTVHDSCVASVTKASVLSDGSPLQGWNMSPSISGDGRFVTFDVGDSSSGSDIISPPSESVLRDTCLGATALAGCEPTTVVLRGMDPTNKTFSAQVDAAGGFVAFLEQAPKGSFQGAVTIRNNCTGATTACMATTYPLATAIGAPSRVMSSALYGNPLIGADGHLIVFSSDATNLASPTSGFGDVFLTQMTTATMQH